jgi:mannose-6-phosphate isomerase-like protein (cupin superfamily)
VPRPGDVIENPITGERVTFVETAASSGGKLLRIDVLIQPGRPSPPLHVHRAFPERHEVLEGRLGIVMAGDERLVEAGGTIEIPAGTPHTFRVAGDAPMRTIVEHPAPRRFEDFLDRVYALAREGKTDEKGAPRNILQTAVLARPHLEEFALVKPPYAVQKALFTVLAPLGRLAGFR